jgi:hypothetical protein
MIIRIDSRAIIDGIALHRILAEAFGFPTNYGRNLDALIDCLSDLDNPKAGMSRVQVFPGQVLLLVLDNVGDCGPHDAGAKAQIRVLSDVVAFVNYRRLEQGRNPVLALAYEAM